MICEPPKCYQMNWFQFWLIEKRHPCINKAISVKYPAQSEDFILSLYNLDLYVNNIAWLLVYNCNLQNILTSSQIPFNFFLISAALSALPFQRYYEFFQQNCEFFQLILALYSHVCHKHDIPLKEEEKYLIEEEGITRPLPLVHKMTNSHSLLCLVAFLFCNWHSWVMGISSEFHFLAALVNFVV